MKSDIVSLKHLSEPASMEVLLLAWGHKKFSMLEDM